MEQILSANNLTMRYHQTLALDGLTLNLPIQIEACCLHLIHDKYNYIIKAIISSIITIFT